jgi:hypothetical protein
LAQRKKVGKPKWKLYLKKHKNMQEASWKIL